MNRCFFVFLCLLVLFSTSVFALGEWVDLSGTDTENWAGTSNTKSLTIASDGNVYTGGNTGELGVYSPTTNIWTDLSKDGTMIPGDIFSLVSVSDGNIYTGLSSGGFGYYSPTADVWTNLSTTDDGGWANQQINSIVVGSDGNIYTILGRGLFGSYSPDTNVWTNLSTTDSGNWAGTSNIYSVAVASDGNIYTGAQSGKLGRYSPVTNVWTNLSMTDDGWAAGYVHSIAVASDGNVYTGLSQGWFGVYSPLTDVWTDLSETDAENWVNFSNTRSVVGGSDGNIYTGLEFVLDGGQNIVGYGGIGRYSPVTNVWTDLSATDVNGWFVADNGFSVFGLGVASDGDVYTGMDGGLFGVYGNPSEPPATEQVKIDFNVYKFGTSTHLSGVQFDCNVNALDLNNQNSPFSVTTDINSVASCDFVVSGYDNNTLTIVWDSNKTQIVYLTPNISFSNLQVFQDGNYTAPVNLNNDSDIIIRWGFTATGIDVNTLSAKVYYTTPFDTNNCYGFIRDEKQCGYKSERNTFSVVSQVGDAYTFRSSAEDDHAFKTWFYNGDPDLYETVTQGVTKSDFNITAANKLVKTLLSSVTVDKNHSYNLSIDARYTGTGTRTLNIYDCNTDLGVLTPINNKNCWVDTITTATTKSLDGFYSILHTSNDLNVINNVKLNVNGNHYIYYTCTGCTPLRYWSIGLIDMNTNIDKPRNWTSTNGVDSFVASSKTVDAHYHALNLTIPNVFRSYFTIDTNEGTTFTSGFYDDSISSMNTVPHIDDFVSPTTGLYSGVVDVNIEVRDSELNDLVCDFNLVDSSLAFVAEIDSSVSPVGGYCTADLNTLAYTDGNYYVLGRVRESATPELLSASEYSREFEINDPVPNVWTDLSSTDSGNWVGTSIIYSVAVASDGNIYTAIDSGKFGVYSSVTNVWTDLSSTDSGNWVSTSGVVSVVVASDGNIYTGSQSGKFGVYSPVTNVWADLSATDSGDWVSSTSSILSVAVASDGNIYTGLSDGKFGVYSPVTNVWTDLSATDSGDWVSSTSSILSVAVASDGNIYTGLEYAKFGVYSPVTNVWTNLSTTDSGNWATDVIYSVVEGLDGNVYTGLDNAKFGRYSPVTNVWTNLSNLVYDPDEFVPILHSVAVGSDGSIYIGLGFGLFAVYSPVTNVWTDLSATDTDNWVGYSHTYSVAVASDGNVYTGGYGGKFGVYGKEFEINTPLIVINSIIINSGTNLDGVNYDLNANISGAESVTYKCYSGGGDGSSCTSASWDCKTGSLTNSSGDNWSSTITGTIKDTNGTWTCEVTAGTTSDSNTIIMNELTGIIVDSSSGTYNGNPGTTNNSILTNESKAYVIITNNGNVNLNLTGIGENFVFGANTILLANQKWYLTNDSGSSVPFTGSTDTIKTNFTKGTYPTSATQNVYSWLDIPSGKISGDYLSTITFSGEKS